MLRSGDIQIPESRGEAVPAGGRSTLLHDGSSWRKCTARPWLQHQRHSGCGGCNSSTSCRLHLPEYTSRHAACCSSLCSSVHEASACVDDVSKEKSWEEASFLLSRLCRLYHAVGGAMHLGSTQQTRSRALCWEHRTSAQVLFTLALPPAAPRPAAAWAARTPLAAQPGAAAPAAISVTGTR